MSNGRRAILALSLSLVAAQASSPSVSAAQVQSAAAPVPAGNGPEQPIPFSHKVHVGTAKLTCDTCHALSRSGESLIIPQAPLCMQCHQTIAIDKPGVQKLTAFAKASQIIPWVRVYEIPSFVRFSHKTHLSHGNTCQECHGPVVEREQLSKETDISMAGCLACHRAKQAATGCDTCHTLEQSDLRQWRHPVFLRGGVSPQGAGRVPFWELPPL